jgi:hypothetical protein
MRNQYAVGPDGYREQNDRLGNETVINGHRHLGIRENATATSVGSRKM